MKTWGKIEFTIDFISEILGRIGWCLVLYAMAFGLTDVLLRYLFNQPSLWISVTIQYAVVLLACVSGPYALRNDAFVRLDVFYEKFSPKKKAISNIITFVFAFLYLYVLIMKGMDAALASISRKEMTPTAIAIPLYHLKTIIPICAFFTLLVVLKNLVIDIQTLFGYQPNKIDK